MNREIRERAIPFRGFGFGLAVLSFCFIFGARFSAGLWNFISCVPLAVESSERTKKPADKRLIARIAPWSS